jgi:hypothetical protein
MKPDLESDSKGAVARPLQLGGQVGVQPLPQGRLHQARVEPGAGQPSSQLASDQLQQNTLPHVCHSL